jgi:peptidoglycan/LPS O-acetylase OafA/YrhL
MLQPLTADSDVRTVVEAPEPRQRAVELDVLRGAGALAVIVLHASAGPLTQESSLGQASWMLLIPNVTARFAVPMFTILSGMALTLSARRDESYPQFLLRRLSSILPAYIAWSLIYACLFPRHESTSVRTVVSDLITGHASNHLYFVPALVRLYLLYPVMSYFARVRWGVVGACALSLSMIWLSPLLPHTAIGAFVDDVLPLRWIGYFVLGIWLANARLANARALGRAQTLAPMVAGVSLVCMIALVRCVIEQSADIDVALGAAEPLVFPYSVGILLWSSGVAFGDGKARRILSFVADHSYSVYLSHMLILHLCALGLQTLGGHSSNAMVFSTGLALSIPLALSIAVLSARAKRSYTTLLSVQLRRS